MSTGRRSTKSTSCPQESSANQNKGYTRWALKWAETHKETHLPTIDFHGRTCQFQGGEQKLTSQVVWMGETHRRVQAIWHSYHLHVQISPCSECPDPCCKKGIRHDLHESLRRKVRTGQLFEEQTEKNNQNQSWAVNKTLVDRRGLHHYKRHDHHVYQNESLFPNYSLGVAPSTECGVTLSAFAIYIWGLC